MISYYEPQMESQETWAQTTCLLWDIGQIFEPQFSLFVKWDCRLHAGGAVRAESRDTPEGPGAGLEESPRYHWLILIALWDGGRLHARTELDSSISETCGIRRQ